MSTGLKIEMLAATGSARMEIYGQIGPSRAGMIDTRMVSDALEGAKGVTDIELRINSKGGDVFEGLGIFNLLKSHPAAVHVKVDGLAGSAASLVAMAGDTIEMPKNALMMIHNPAAMLFGGVEDFKRAVTLLSKIQSVVVDTYANRSGRSREEIAAWMQSETYFTGTEAREAGFATMVTGEQEPAKEINEGAFLFSRSLDQFESLLSVAMVQTEEVVDMAETIQAAATESNAAQAASEAVVMAQDAVSIAREALKEGLAAERTRAAEIMAACTMAKKPEMATEFIASGASLQEVQSNLLRVVCLERPAVDAGGTGDIVLTSDPDAKFKAEFAEDRKMLMKAGISEADYIASRRISEGVDCEAGVVIRA